MKRLLAIVLIILLGIPMYSKEKKSKAEKQAEKAEAQAREQFSRQAEIVFEQKAPGMLESFANTVTGDRMNNVRCVSQTHCGVDARGRFGGLCLPGDRRVLMISGFSNPNTMLGFGEELKKDMSKLRSLGFTYVELRSAYQSATFPDGIYDIAVY